MYNKLHYTHTYAYTYTFFIHESTDNQTYYCKYSRYKKYMTCQAWWCTPFIPALEAEAGGSVSSSPAWSEE